MEESGKGVKVKGEAVGERKKQKSRILMRKIREQRFSCWGGKRGRVEEK